MADRMLVKREFILKEATQQLNPGTSVWLKGYIMVVIALNLWFSHSFSSVSLGVSFSLLGLGFSSFKKVHHYPCASLWIFEGYYLRKWRGVHYRKLSPWTLLPVPVLQEKEQELLCLKSVSLLLDHSRSMTTETLVLLLFGLGLPLYLHVDLQFWFCLEHSFFFIFTCCLLIIQTLATPPLLQRPSQAPKPISLPCLSFLDALHNVILLYISLRICHSCNHLVHPLLTSLLPTVMWIPWGLGRSFARLTFPEM